MDHPSRSIDARRAVVPVLLSTLWAAALAAQDPAPAPTPTPKPAAATSEEATKPWRLDRALGTPDWLTISGEVRVRYEGLEGQFRSTSQNLDNSDHLGFSRTSLRADADFDRFGATLEVLDARHYGGGTGSFLRNSNVNPIDFLQAYGELDTGKIGEGESRFRIGRETMDLGSRRLVARNRFRNTINAFDAVDFEWSGEKSSVRAFWSMPVIRRPILPNDLRNNEPVMDDQTRDRQFYGAFFETEYEGTGLELYAFGLNEDGGNTAQRNLYTPGFRVVRKKKQAALDYELESAIQFGDTRIGMREVDHLAYFTHISFGYTFDYDWKPRVRVAYDYASGDSSRNDGKNGRFDTLFGARRFEYGPTGIYGAIARSNISSPELRFEAKPNARTDCMIAWRWLWLAQGDDQWTTARLTDSAGVTDNYVGNQIEARVRYDIVPKNVRLDVGAAHLFAGNFIEDVANSRGEDSTYVYAQMFFYF